MEIRNWKLELEIMKIWIPLKSEYLIDNYKNLLTYLSQINNYKTSDSFLKETIDLLEEVAFEYLDNYFSHKSGIHNEVNEEFDRNLKIVLGYILAAHYSGREYNKALVSLIDSLIVNEFDKSDQFIEKIKELVIGLATGGKLTSLPFLWNGVVSDEAISPSLLCLKFTNCNVIQKSEGKFISENKGVFLIDKGEFFITLMNLNTFKNSNIKGKIPGGMGVTLLTKDKTNITFTDFKDEIALLNRIVASVDAIKPEVQKNEKRYFEGDEMYVKVVRKAFNTLTCKTVSSEHLPIQGNLLLPESLSLNIFLSIPKTKIIEKIKEGDVFKAELVKIEDRYFFSIDKARRQYYYDLDGLEEEEAVFMQNYQGGTRWLTKFGKMVNIKDSDDEELSAAASLDSNKIIDIKYLGTKADRSNNIVINASKTEGDAKSMNRQEFLDQIPDNTIEDFIYYWTEQEDFPQDIETEVEEDEKKTAPYYFSLLGHLLTLSASNLDTHLFDRYINLVFARIIAKMLDEKHEEIYCEHYLGYLQALWAFAQDTGNELMKEPVIPEELLGIEEVKKRNRIVNSLCNYKVEKYEIDFNLENKVDPEVIESLVEASNTLNGKISLTELKRIKRNISKKLGLEAIHKEEVSLKYFGEESDILEFKTSVVFPPANRTVQSQPANPDIQIWAIIKTINGFLNSLNGGSLIIGVNDYGYATGVDEDIKWLLQNNQLRTDSIDSYIQYVKHRVDNAFSAYSRQDQGNEITATRIRYTAEEKEGYKILRIQIQPYEFGCVRINDEIKIYNGLTVRKPKGIKDSYQRTSGSTEELNSASRKTLEQQKRNMIRDGEEQKAISVQEGIELRKVIKLSSYHSAKGVKDRFIKPMELLPVRGLVVGIEVGDKKPKVFKLRRCSNIEVTDEPILNKKQTEVKVDAFNMGPSETGDSFEVIIKLNRRAWLLMKEEYPITENDITETDDNEFPYELKTRIQNVAGIGRFCLSLPGQYKIEKGDRLKQYLKEQIEKFQIL